MIKITNDTYLKEIYDLSELGGLTTKENYKICGLPKRQKKAQDSYCVEFNFNSVPYGHIYDDIVNLRFFLYNINGLPTTYKLDYNTGEDANFIKIGLREDIREDIELSANIIKTSILVIEKKMKFQNKEIKRKIKGIPVFA